MEGIIRALGATAESMKDLYLVLGPFWVPVFILLLFGVPLFVTVRWDRSIRAGYREALATKQKAVDRLADENRAWREHFFRQQGVDEDKIEKMMAPARR